MAEVITIDVVHAPASGEPFHVSMQLPTGTTVEQAIERSGVRDAMPGLDVSSDRLGIYSRKVGPDHVLRDGDRVEIYRSLALDPKEARRRRAR